MGSPTSGWCCVLRPAIVLEAVPPSSRFGPAPSRCVPLLRARCVCGGFNRLLLLCLPSGCGHPLGQNCLSVTLDRDRRFTLLGVPFRCCHPFLWSRCRIHTSSFGLSELLVAGGRALTWLVTALCQWAVFSWPHLLLSYES